MQVGSCFTQRGEGRPWEAVTRAQHGHSSEAGGAGPGKALLFDFVCFALGRTTANRDGGGSGGGQDREREQESGPEEAEGDGAKVRRQNRDRSL